MARAFLVRAEKNRGVFEFVRYGESRAEVIETAMQTLVAREGYDLTAARDLSDLECRVRGVPREVVIA